MQSITGVEEVNLMKRLSLTLMEKIKSQAEPFKDNQAEEYCPVCYEATIKEGDANTFKFGCNHTFCRECAKASLALKVQQNQLEMIVCPQALCGHKVTLEEIQNIFNDDPELLKKYETFKSNAEVDKDPLMRWCTKPGCKGFVRGKSLDEKMVQCPECHTKICF